LGDLVQVLFAQSDDVINAAAPKESFDNLLRKPFCRRMSDHRNSDRASTFALQQFREQFTNSSLHLATRPAERGDAPLFVE
jgi:hypothetical protein